MKRILTLILGSLLFTSCYTTTSLANRIDSNPMKLTPDVLTGLYENRIEGDDVNSLWNDLCLHKKDKKQNIAEGNQVFLSYTNENEITAELYEDDVLLDTMTLPGKPSSDYFTIRKGSHFFTIILITSIKSKKTIIGNDSNANLLIAQGYSHNAMFLENNADDDSEVITGVYMRRSDDRPAQ
ncbi:MAG: hypothetical protein ACSHWW_05720 [Nonlabens sp.]|uniref:hypothetical protein n=1 Tax=Nonlabens sp. TaxID=1888209 RepID=UPI003EF97A3E